jgi:hypothetical protein
MTIEVQLLKSSLIDEMVKLPHAPSIQIGVIFVFGSLNQVEVACQ